MRIHLFAAAREQERARRPRRGRFEGAGVANLTLPGLAALVPRHHAVVLQDEQVAPLDLDAPMDLAFVTAKTCYAPRAYEVARALRARGVPVVMGGCHVSLNPDEAAAHADAVVLGEAEHLMAGLLDDAARGSLAPRYQGRQADLATVPVPRRDLLQKRYVIDAIMVSRGCDFACRFCCIRGFYGQGFRGRPISLVVDEVRTLGPWLGFLDENLVADRDWGRALFQALTPLDRLWMGQVSADILRDPDLVELAGRSGAVGFHVGLESLNPANLRAEGKVQNDAAAYRELVERCHRAGILVAAGIIFGLDGDGPEVFDETLETMRRIGVDLAYFRMATPYPGTPFFERLARQGRILTRDWSRYDGYFPVFAPKGMSARQLFEGTRRAQAAFYTARALAGRLNALARLRMPLWAGLNMNRMARGAFAPSHAQAEAWLREIEA